ncbi:MAG TPA: ABC transporter substrate-binding protein [Candidatus Limiplasma sp.]|nr:ABC transporter substrate-binding protein [Candidatus Limiplasma sp.]
MMKNVTRKLLAVIFAAVLILSTCTFASAETIELTFAFDQGVGEPTLKLLEQFNASQSDIHVNSYVLPQDANNLHDDFVNKMIAGDTSVDVMALDVVFVSEFASAGWLMPLNDAFDATAQADYIPGTIESATYQGTLYAMPWFTNASMLFYRKDLLDSIGVTTPPTTYQGWIDVYEKLKDKVDYAFSFQASQSEALVCNWCEFVWNNGGEIFDADGKPVVTSDAVVAATQNMADLIGTYAPEGTTTYAETESQQVFQEGKALTCRTWSGTWNTFNNAAESSVAGNVAVCNLPVATEGQTAHACMGGLDVTVNNAIDDAHKQAAITFIKWITSFDTQKQMTLLSSQPPAFAKVYEDTDILKAIPFYADFFPIISDGKGRPVSPNYSEVSDAIQRNIHQALTKEVTVQDALKTLQTELEAF